MMQKKRPVLHEGDVCLIAKKYRHRYSKKASVVVLKVSGDGSDRDSHITCSVSIPDCFGRGGFAKPYKKMFRRECLWFTGYNIHKGKASKSQVSRSVSMKRTITEVNKNSAYSQARGPHTCRCSDEDFTRNGCTCNGL